MKLLFLAFLHLFANAKEGFNEAPDKELSEKVWKATVGIYADKGDSMGIGSGAIVAIDDKHISILTVAHNFFSIKNAVVTHEIDSEVVASAKIVVNFKSQNLHENKTSYDLLSEKIEILKYDINSDLALVRAELKSGIDLQQIDIASLPDKCQMIRGETLMAVGHPSTDLRLSKNVSITDSDITMKRWSEGVFTSGSRSSYDCISGCSGGPVVNKDNKLVGIHQASLSIGGLPYLGNDRLLGAHSTFASCSSIQKFRDGLF